MQILNVLLALALVASSSAFLAGLFKESIATVSQIDVNKYTGRWYQVYLSRWSSIFAPKGYCVTATYGKFNDTTITVFNSGRKGGPTGEEQAIRGHAYATEESGKFKLNLAGVPFTGNYWVIKLGPVINGQYQYSVVSDTNRLGLYVLARDPETFKKYDAEVKEFLNKNHYNEWLNEPLPSYHDKDCIYPPMPTN
ncbi:uncharacterized protein LOC106181955 [Lingula anatina]|uniref:Uncharacterized protein LOC106181955 n=1 Tax=Lingula anatina TaxID=7574 RepID=A0A1S3KH71_LINAN|nr:uncharacterized protein LOC106181955 [Lingula anatina]|eukprot:XP_013421978.1 uncharacterized protein LOC106181955 [Lingula anatina]